MNFSNQIFILTISVYIFILEETSSWKPSTIYYRDTFFVTFLYPNRQYPCPELNKSHEIIFK